MALRWTVDPRQPDPGVIDRAADVLRAGRLLILPTETVYGLGGDPARPGTVEEIFRAKARPRDKHLVWLVDSRDSLRRLDVALCPQAEALARAYWPGPLTLVVEAHGRSRGYRVPDHQVACAVIRSFGGPLAVTSANRSGRPAPTSADEAESAVGTYAAATLDAGPAPGGVPSSVVRVQAGRIEILREGAIASRDIEMVKP
jgi:L-threonylcarbamoyladenylate synthase